MTAPQPLAGDLSDLVERLTLYEHREGYDGKDWESVASEAAAAIRKLSADLKDCRKALVEIGETAQISRARHIARSALPRNVEGEGS